MVDQFPLSGHRLAVWALESGDLRQATSLAQTLGLPLLTGALKHQPADCILLMVSTAGLGLQPLDRRSGAVRVDFIAGKVNHRRRFGGGQGQHIARAVGIKGVQRPSVLDLTAGFGTDSFVLAGLGCRVNLVERHPLVKLLLQDGLRRAAQFIETASIVARMQLHHDSARQVLNQWCVEPPDVIYLDPMFPRVGKHASQGAASKEMSLLRQLVGVDADAEKLLQPALALARYRVVVKRPRLAPYLDNRQPAYQLIGKANRFDIHVIQSFSQ